VVAGDGETAGQWLAVAQSPASGVLSRLAGIPGSQPPSSATLAAWRSSLRGVPPHQAERRLAVVQGLLTALGDSVPAEEWVALMGGPPLTSATVPQPALWHALPAAAAAGRRAETVLLALAALGEAGPGGAEPTTLHRVVAALHGAGLTEEARSLAAEAAIANGI
jgi:hypothetical protein